MQIETTGIEGLLVIQPAVYGDDRGYFMETYNARNLAHADLTYTWVQDNEAQSSRGVLRGLHLQKGDHAQAKLVRVITGAVLDVAVDLRPESKTYGRAFTIELTGANKLQLLVPRGFAHGYLSLEDDTIFTYKVDNYYCREAEAGLRYDDPSLGIEWGIEEDQLLVIGRDQDLPLLEEIDPLTLW